MMGPAVGRQDRLFYEFDLEDMVPDGLRSMSGFGRLRSQGANQRVRKRGLLTLRIDRLRVAREIWPGIGSRRYVRRGFDRLAGSGRDGNAPALLLRAALGLPGVVAQAAHLVFGDVVE